jgi:hypothetical protein
LIINCKSAWPGVCEIINLFYFNPNYNVLICTSCQYAIHSTAIARHLYSRHKAVIPYGKVQEYARLFTPDSLLPPWEIKQLHIPTNAPPILHLQVYNNGYYCKLYSTNQLYVICTEDILFHHLKKVYHWSKNKGFTDQPLQLRLLLSSAAYFPVTCQIFYTKEYTRYFLVNNGRPGSDPAPTQFADAFEKPPLSLPEQIKQTLAQKF